MLLDVKDRSPYVHGQFLLPIGQNLPLVFLFLPNDALLESNRAPELLRYRASESSSHGAYVLLLYVSYGFVQESSYGLAHDGVVPLLVCALFDCFEVLRALNSLEHPLVGDGLPQRFFSICCLLCQPLLLESSCRARTGYFVSIVGNCMSRLHPIGSFAGLLLFKCSVDLFVFLELFL